MYEAHNEMGNHGKHERDGAGPIVGMRDEFELVHADDRLRPTRALLRHAGADHLYTFGPTLR